MILIVEDDVVNCELLQILLKRQNLSYLVAYDGLEAMQVFEQNTNINLVLLDIRLPKLSGEVVLTKMKALRPQVPIIVQTAYVFEIDRVQFFALGCDDYITKPIIKEQLYEKIGYWLKKQI
jgi:two-component system CheB/CheR fusion protein